MKKLVILLVVVISVISTVQAASYSFGRIEGKHIKFNRYAFMILGAAFLIGVENIILKQLLEIFNPILLYFFLLQPRIAQA